MGGQENHIHRTIPFTYKDTFIFDLHKEAQDEIHQVLVNELFDYMHDPENSQRKREAQLLYMFLCSKYNSDKRIKKMLINKLKEDPTLNYCSVIILERIEDMLGKLNGSSKYTNWEIINILQFINFNMQNDCLGKINSNMLDNILHYNFQLLRTCRNELIDISTSNQNQNKEICHILNGVLKQILSLLLEYQPPKVDAIFNEFIILSYEFLKIDALGFDIKNKCGLLLIQCLHLISEDVGNHNNFDNVILELLTSNLNGKWKTLLDLLETDETKIVLYQSILNKLPTDQVSNIQIYNKNLIIFLYEELILASQRATHKPPLLIEATKTVCTISKQFQSVDFQFSEIHFEQGIMYTLALSEHFVDSVKSNVKKFFRNMIQLASMRYQNGNEAFVNVLLEHIYYNPNKRKIHFVGLEYFCNSIGTEFITLKFNDVHDYLLEFLLDDTLCETVSYTYKVLMTDHFKTSNKSHWMDTWVRPVLFHLKKSRDSKHPVYQALLMAAFELYPATLRILFPTDQIGDSKEWGVILKCLKLARNSKLNLALSEYDTLWRGLIEKEKLKLFMIHRDKEIRLATVSVIVEAAKSTELFSDWEFNFLLEFYKLNVPIETPSIRKQVICLYKKAITRCHAGLDVLNRNANNLLKKGNKCDKDFDTMSLLKIQMDSSQEFLEKFTLLLISHLTPDSNYPRRCSALELLLFVEGKSEKDHWISLWQRDDIENLKNVLYDTYEENKKMASVLLQTLDIFRGSYGNFSDLYTQAMNMLEDVKPSTTLTAAYMLKTCSFKPTSPLQQGYQQEDVALEIINHIGGKFLNISETDSTDMLKVPIHGYLLALRHLIQSESKCLSNESLSTIFRAVLGLITSIKEIVMPVVTNTSPEGRVYDYDDSVITDETSTAQTVLVNAWRTMKELTLLMGEIVSQSIKEDEKELLLTVNDLTDIGEFFVQIFIEAKHRGVFEQAYNGFVVTCASLLKSPSNKLNILPDIWLTRALCLCTGEIADDRLCPTRRSAGLPFFILGILTANPSYNIIETTMRELLNTANNLSFECIPFRTHCLNILRAVYRHSKLGDFVAPYVEEGMLVALKGFESNTWSVRNASTLLFAALITRMFGVQRSQEIEDVSFKNKLTVRVFLTKYPTLFEYIENVLPTECTKGNSLILRPILTILSRLYPSHIEASNDKMEKCLPFIRKCLIDCSLHIRELAAKVLVTFLGLRNVGENLNSLFAALSQKGLSHNEYHGILLQIHFCLKYCDGKLPLPVLNYIERSKHIALEQSQTNFLNRSTYLEILITLLHKNEVPAAEAKYINEFLIPLIDERFQYDTQIIRETDFERLSFGFAVISLARALPGNNQHYENIATRLTRYLCLDASTFMRNYVIQIFIALNQTKCRDNFRIHPLYTTEEMEIPESIRSILSPLSDEDIEKILYDTHKQVKEMLFHNIESALHSDKFLTLELCLLLPYYPCVLRSLNGCDNVKTFKQLLNICQGEQEDLNGAVLHCISTLLSTLEEGILRKLSYDCLIEILHKNAVPEATDYNRLVVCDFLKSIRFMFYSSNSVIKGQNLINIFDIIMILFEDDQICVRNSIADLNKCQDRLTNTSVKSWECTSTVARTLFLKKCIHILSAEQSISFLFSWAFRKFPEQFFSSSEVFEKGELNLFAENVPLVECIGDILVDSFWNVNSNTTKLSQCFRFTKMLQNALKHSSCNRIDPEAKKALLVIFESILIYCNENKPSDINFKYFCKDNLFSKIFNKINLPLYTSSLKNCIFLIYKPML